MDTLPTATPAGGACRLTDLGLIRAHGADAVSFLHGQLSNDVKLLKADQARLGAFCTAQGRMLASMVYGKRGAEEVWLALRADLLAPTLKRLSMFVLRAKARLTDASAELTAVGLAGASAATALGADAPATAWAKQDRGDAMLLRLPDAREGDAVVPRWLWIGPGAEADALLSGLPALDTGLWAWWEVASGVAPVAAATSGQFVPQMLNYELVGGVDFKKGCYPGQEVVARSQYLGKLKRRAFQLETLEPGVSAAAGQEVFQAGDSQPAGLVAYAATSGGATRLLAELKIGAASGPLHLGAPDGPALRVLPLPYVLPHEQADTAA